MKSVKLRMGQQNILANAKWSEDSHIEANLNSCSDRSDMKRKQCFSWPCTKKCLHLLVVNQILSVSSFRDTWIKWIKSMTPKLDTYLDSAWGPNQQLIHSPTISHVGGSAVGNDNKAFMEEGESRCPGRCAPKGNPEKIVERWSKGLVNQCDQSILVFPARGGRSESCFFIVSVNVKRILLCMVCDVMQRISFQETLHYLMSQTSGSPSLFTYCRASSSNQNHISTGFHLVGCLLVRLVRSKVGYILFLTTDLGLFYGISIIQPFRDQ